MKKIFLKLSVVILTAFVLLSCNYNPFSGKRTMALVGNDNLFATSALQYREFLSENTVITRTRDADTINNVGNRIKMAAEKWAASAGQSDYLNDYNWEFNLVQSDEVNAWAMPGGKVVFYTGILPVTMNEAGIAVVMGHEIAHIILNHGQQRVSADILQSIGAIGLSIFTADQSPETRALLMTVYGAGSTLFGTLPYSRAHEIEADQVGLVLMAIAGYDPQEAVAFWERMSNQGGASIPQFLSTHPSDETRVAQMRDYIPEAIRKAREIGVLQ